MSNHSKYIYIPACSLASRWSIEQSSYMTTPDLSPGEGTPPSGQAIYKHQSLTEENIESIGAALKLNQRVSDQSPSVDRNSENHKRSTNILPAIEVHNDENPSQTHEAIDKHACPGVQASNCIPKSESADRSDQRKSIDDRTLSPPKQP